MRLQSGTAEDRAVQPEFFPGTLVVQGTGAPSSQSFGAYSVYPYADTGFPEDISSAIAPQLQGIQGG